MALNPTKLKQMEAEALLAATTRHAREFLGAVMGVAYDDGVRDLGALTPDRMDRIAALVAQNNDYQMIVLKIFLAYSNKVRLVITNAVEQAKGENNADRTTHET